MILTDKTLPDAVPGSAYSTQLTERGGTPAFGWSIESGALLAGMTLSTDGVISGTPTTPGTYQVKVRVRDAAAQNDWRLFTIKAGCRPPPESTRAQVAAAHQPG